MLIRSVKMRKGHKIRLDEGTGRFDELQHLKSGLKDESYSFSFHSNDFFSLFCFNYTVVRKSPFTQKSNVFFLIQLDSTL